MATRYAVATGNWSALATWDGGASLPGVNDDVYADGKTVTIDQNVTVLSLRNTQRSGGTAGGTFTLSNGFTITATGVGILAGSTTTTCVTYAGASNTTITAGITGGSVNPSIGFSTSGAGTVTINGNISSGPSAGAVGVSATNGNVTVTGTVTAAASHGIQYSTASGTLNVTGAVINNNSTNGHAIHVTSTAATVNVTGNVTVGTQPTYGINNSGAGTSIYVTGSVTGGSASGAYGINCSGAASATRVVQVIGTVTCGTGDLAHGVFDQNSGGGWCAVGGSLIDNANGYTALYVRRFKCIATLNTTRQHANNAGGAAITYGSLDYIPNNVPVPADVRYGTVYGNSSYTGTCRVPAASSVASGVPVDNTTGTAVLTAAAIWDTLTSTMTTAGSIGERLKNTATVATTGDQLAATFP